MEHYQKKLVGVLGDPVDDNPSVVIEQAAFDYCALPFQYLTIQVKQGDLQAAIAGIRAMGFSGANITMPHKMEVLNYLDQVAEDAKVIGAVNTIYWKDGKLTGGNTDGKGFLRSLQKGGVPISGKKAVILGAGGAARAIAVELANGGAEKIKIVNRREGRGRELAELINSRTKARADFTLWQGNYGVDPETDILVNATPVGFGDKDALPAVEYGSLKSSMIVCDVIPDRESTPFLEKAKAAGCRTFHGLGMLVEQGALAFELWTGEEAPVEVMTQALLAGRESR